jgi:hypothetical protein
MPPSASVITPHPHIISKFQTLHRTTSYKDPPYVFSELPPPPKIFHNLHIGVILDMKIEGSPMELLESVGSLWPIGVSFITLVIVLSKMHAEIDILKEKVKTLFDLYNDMRSSKKDK